MNNPLVVKLFYRINFICTDKTIILCWIPSHIGIRGNEKADMAAKESLNHHVFNMKVPYTDSKQYINTYIFTKWQELWNSCQNNKLYQIKPILREWLPGFRQSRREETVLTRIRIGHSYTTHAFLLKGEDPPECVACQESYTIKHILLECADLALIRRRFYNVNSLKDLFEEINVNKILDFLKEIDLFNKL